MPERIAMSEKDESRSGGSSLEEFLRLRDEIDQNIRERFQREVVIMFTDIVSSTEYFEVRGDLEGRSMVQRHNDLVFPIIEKHGGRILKALGDGLMISFDDLHAAALAAIEIQKTLAARNEGKPSHEHIWLKIAIHQGQGIVEERDVFGDVVNTAARLSALASKADILISQDFLEAVRGLPGISTKFFGTRTLKGKALPVDIHHILWDDSHRGDLRRSFGNEVRSGAMAEARVTLHFQVEECLIRSIAYLFDGQAQIATHSGNLSAGRDEIDRIAETVGQYLGKVDDNGRLPAEDLRRLKTAGKELHDALVPESMARFIGDSNASSLTVQMDGSLTNIPWELLYDGEMFWCCRFCMGKLVATSEKPRGRVRELSGEPLRMLVVADPGGDLPASREEGLAIQEQAREEPGLAGVSVDVMDQEASSGVILSRIAGYDFFHFAGHYNFDPDNPSGSGLMLADGVLEVGRLSELSTTRALPALVFANACHSGRTHSWVPEDHIHALADAFISSGVRHYIGSTIDLFDRSSATFAEEFYGNLGRGMTVGDALRHARLRCISIYGEETMTWASYVLYGDPAFCYLPQEAPARAAATAPPAESTAGTETMAAAAAASATGAAVAADEPAPVRTGASRLFRKHIAAVLIAALLVSGFFLWKQFAGSGPKGDQNARKAFDLLHAGQVEQAGELFVSIGEKDPLYSQGMAALHLTRGNLEEAERRLAMARDGADEGYTAVLKAHAVFMRGKLDEAGAAYSRALAAGKLEPWQQAECHFGLGRIQAKKGNLEKAVEEYDRSLSLDGGFLQALTAKGVILERTGNLGAAVQSYERAAALNPNDAMSLSLYKRSREELATRADAERRAKIDALVADIVKAHRDGKTSSGEGSDSSDVRDEWRSRPVYFFSMDFEAKGLPPAREGEDTFMAELVFREIGDSTRFHQVERALLDSLLEELKLSTTALADQQTALRVGKITSARLLIAGSVLRYANQLQFALRAIDTETTRIVAVANDSCHAAEDPAPMLQRAAKLLKDRLASAFPIRGRVADVQDKTLVLDVGSGVGVVPGMRLRVVEKDAAGGEVEVKEVEEASCSAHPLDPTAPSVQKGWRVIESQAAKAPVAGSVPSGSGGG